MQLVNYNVIQLTGIPSPTNPIIFPSSFQSVYSSFSPQRETFSLRGFILSMLYYQGDHTRDDLPRRFLRATILTLFYNNVASCDALNILPFNSASSILGDPGTISRVGRNGGESFQFVLYPIDLPWVSKDARLKTKTKTVSGKGHEQFLSDLSFFIILISLCQLFKCLPVYCFEDVCVRTIVFSHFCHISTKLLIQHLSSGVL